MVKNLDVKVLRLAKFGVPQSDSFLGDADFGYASLGHFQLVDVCDVDDDDGTHPLKKVFESTCKKNLNRTGDEYDSLSEQMVYLFRNFDDSKNKWENNTENFWNSNIPILFCSMIHIETSNVEIEEKKKKIAEMIYKKTKNKAIIYYTFDYSDLVVFYKDSCFSNYLETIAELLYKSNMFSDSYTIYSIDKKFLTKIKDNNIIRQDDSLIKDYSFIEENLYMSINISTSDSKIINEIKKYQNEFDDSIIYIMFGRNDFSIINHTGNIIWLANMLLLIDNIIENNKLSIIAYESFVKKELSKELINKNDKARIININILKNSADEKLIDGLSCNKIINPLKYDKIQVFCEKILELFKVEPLLNRFVFPLYNINKSICSIAKNGFAEEFIISILDAYIRILEIIYEILCNKNDGSTFEIENEIANVLSDFSSVLNSQINGMMHSERQFIQSTSFNAIYYDIPPKLMAYYTTYLHNLIEIMRDVNESNYSCLLEPSFDSDISVSNVVIYDAPPSDRILSIKINESTFFDVNSVHRVLSHEIAHYVGDYTRNRNMRGRKICKYIILNIVTDMFKLEISDEFNSTIDNIYKDLCESKHLDKEKIYSDDLCDQLTNMYIELIETIDSINDNSVCEIFRKNICGLLVKNFKKIKENYSENKDIYSVSISLFSNYSRNYFNSNYLHSDVSRLNIEEEDIQFEFIANNIYKNKFSQYVNSKINKFKSDIVENFTEETYYPIASIYSESFADLQSILIQGVSFEEYLQGFLYSENIDTESLDNDPNTILRILALKMVMIKSKIWDDSNIKDTNIVAFNEYLNNSLNKISEKGVDNNIKNIDFAKISKQYNKSNIKFENDSNFQMQNVSKCFSNEYIKESLYGIVFIQLVDYLSNCLLRMLEYYSNNEKEKIIIQMRKSNKIIKNFDNMASVFQVINNEIYNYKDFLLKRINDIQ